MNHGQFYLANRLVELIHKNFDGFHAGYRGVHAQGRYYAGTFVATPEAKRLSRAVHFQGEPIPVSVRHSNRRSGNPFGAPDAVSMAVKFYLPDGTVTDLIMLPLSRFLAPTPEDVLGFLEAKAPDPITGVTDMEKVKAFLSTHPKVADAIMAAEKVPTSVSLAQTAFHALHAFRFVNAEGVETYARYHWEPEAGVASQSVEELQSMGPSYLFDEYEDRLAKGPVVFNLVLQLAGEGDSLDDPSAAWPEDRDRVVVGRLEVKRPTSVEELGDPVMLHDPTRVTDGIELSDDPILAARRGIYEVSVAYRTGGWKGPIAAQERMGCPFGS